MLRKKDLVKQFELVVKQEIIDHNKSIEANNLAINKLRTDLDDFNATLSKDIIKLSLKSTSLSKNQSEVESSTDKIKLLFTNLSNNQYLLNEKNNKKIRDIAQDIKETNERQELLGKRISSLEMVAKSIKKELKRADKQFDTNEEKTRNSLTAATKRLKKEMLDIPCEAGKVRDEFMKELSMHKLDNEGLLKEIKVLKKTNFINEKKIENLYTLIDRLNNKGKS